MPKLYDLQPVEPADWQELIDFYDRVTEATLGKEHNPGWAKGAWPHEDFLTAIITKKRLFKACVDGKIAAALGADHNATPGYEKICWHVAATPEEVTVWHVLAVDPRWQGQGVAKQLVSLGLELARQENQKAVRLDVYPINLPGRRLYESCGFAYLGQRPLYYDGYGTIDSHIYEYDL